MGEAAPQGLHSWRLHPTWYGDIRRTQICLQPFYTMVTIHRHSDSGWLILKAFAPFFPHFSTC